MKVARIISLAAVGLIGAAYVPMSQGCSSSTASPSASPGATTPGAAPQKPSAGKTVSADEHNFAVYSVFVGDTDRSGATSTTAWKTFGYNLDGKVTGQGATDVCTPLLGSTDAQVDGDNGIDNAFGHEIVPIIKQYADKHAPSKQITDQLQSGAFTMMLDLKGLGTEAAQTATGLTGQVFVGGTFANPSFTTGDKWPVVKELLNDGQSIASGSKVSFGDSYVVNGTWVSGGGDTVAVRLTIAGISVALTIHQAILTFDHRGSNAENGMIAGVVNTEELVASLKDVVGRLTSLLCDPAVFDSVAKQIRQASDMMTNGPNVAGTPCDAISIGIGFTAKEISPPSAVAEAPAPPPDLCATGGGEK